MVGEQSTAISFAAARCPVFLDLPKVRRMLWYMPALGLYMCGPCGYIDWIWGGVAVPVPDIQLSFPLIVFVF